MSIILRRDKGSALTHDEMDNNFYELAYVPAGKVFPSASGVGIKIDVNNPDWGWHDMLGYLHADDTRYAPYRGNIKSITFEENESAYASFHFPHDYAVGTDVFIHVHWSHTSSTVVSGSVTWGFELLHGEISGIFEEPVVVSVQQQVGNQYQHMVAEAIASTPGGSPVLLNTNKLCIDDVVQCRLFLDSNDIVTSDSSVVKPFAHFADIHYRSTALPTKNKTPNFWS
jgi:hypothetical protein